MTIIFDYRPGENHFWLSTWWQLFLTLDMVTIIFDYRPFDNYFWLSTWWQLFLTIDLVTIIFDCRPDENYFWLPTWWQLFLTNDLVTIIFDCRPGKKYFWRPTRRKNYFWLPTCLIPPTLVPSISTSADSSVNPLACCAAFTKASVALFTALPAAYNSQVCKVSDYWLTPTQ